MNATPTAEPAPPAAAADDERLGGSRTIAASAPRPPHGFAAEPVAAGFTAPSAVAAAEGRLYVIEAGHPRRTPPRLFRVEPASGAASLLAEFERSVAGETPSLTPVAGRLLVLTADGAWLVEGDGAIGRVEVPIPIGATQAGFIRGSWLADDGDWYLVDPGSRDARGSFTPGAGIVWRIRAGEPSVSRSLTVRWSPRRVRELIAAAPRPALALGLGVALAAAALALYYGRRRGGAATGR